MVNSGNFRTTAKREIPRDVRTFLCALPAGKGEHELFLCRQCGFRGMRTHQGRYQVQSLPRQPHLTTTTNGNAKYPTNNNNRRLQTSPTKHTTPTTQGHTNTNHTSLQNQPHIHPTHPLYLFQNKVLYPNQNTTTNHHQIQHSNIQDQSPKYNTSSKDHPNTLQYKVPRHPRNPTYYQNPRLYNDPTNDNKDDLPKRQPYHPTKRTRRRSNHKVLRNRLKTKNFSNTSPPTPTKYQS